ncbi:hypothetical protein ABZ783_00985 [Micromonospora sp. NPDC047738]
MVGRDRFTGDPPWALGGPSAGIQARADRSNLTVGAAVTGRAGRGGAA